MKILNRSRRARLAGLIGSLLIVFMAQSDALAADRKSPLKPYHVESLNHLKRLLSAKSVQAGNLPSIRDTSAGGALAAQTASSAHSETNVQVAGVDEGDIAKTDGQYIYTVQNGEVRIVRAFPADSMAEVATIEADSGFSPVELYLNGNQLVVIGWEWHSAEAAGGITGSQTIGIMPVYGEEHTIARVYDISDRARPAMQRQVEFTGSYLSSRKIGDDVYLVGRCYPNYFVSGMATTAARSSRIGQPAMTRDNLLPRVADTVVGNGREQTLPLSGVYYLPGFVEPDYVIVAGFRLNAPKQPADIKAYLGSGDTVYASAQNLYLSAADYSITAENDNSSSSPVTHLYKFALNNGHADFRATGEIPGTVLNAFSMDEHQGYFRTATTVDQWTQTSNGFDQQNWNNVYTLDGNMKITGRLEHLAEGERIYSARFIGDRSYLVTFRQTDPLFVIDLSNPENPNILGELKIPGFSNYLHPYDEDHILGFGQDTQETENGGVIPKGIKVALFDVSDVRQPVQLHSLTIGEQGTYSELLYNHKALLFDKARGLLGFPISETATLASDNWPTEVFQGAQIYKISLGKGFEKLAAISHGSSDQPYDWYRSVQRLFTIDDQLYTLSNARIQANDLTTFSQTGFVDFPLEQVPVDEPLMPIVNPGAVIR